MFEGEMEKTVYLSLKEIQNGIANTIKNLTAFMCFVHTRHTATQAPTTKTGCVTRIFCDVSWDSCTDNTP